MGFARGSERRRSASGSRALACALLLPGLLACTPAAPDGPRLVVLYATCSLNKDHLSPYDPAVAYTPAFERFEAESVVFERHQTESGQSGTAFAALFTGTQASEHGVYRHPSHLSEAAEPVTEVFARAGWDVHTWLEHPMASAELGYARGAHVPNQHRQALLASDPAFGALLEALRADPDRRALVVTNFTVTHGPYPAEGMAKLCANAPALCRAAQDYRFNRLRSLYTRHHSALSYDFEGTVDRLGLDASEVELMPDVVHLLYRASVVTLDERFGALLDAVDEAGLREESVIAFTSDHGEILVEDGFAYRWTHGFQLAPDVLNIAWMLRAPGLEPGRVEGVTRSIDVLPTLAGLAGIEGGAPRARGVDLSGALAGEQPFPGLLAFSHTALLPIFWWKQEGKRPPVRRYYPDPGSEWMWVGVRDGDWFQQIDHRGDGVWRNAVFDLSAKTGERADQFDASRDDHAATAETLAAYKAELRNAESAGRTDAERVEEERQMQLLRSLGYIE